MEDDNDLPADEGDEEQQDIAAYAQPPNVAPHDPHIPYQQLQMQQIQQQQIHIQQQQLQQHQQQLQNTLLGTLQTFWGSVMEDVESDDFKTHSLPLARIKKIMRVDPDVKMISAEAPALFEKAIEIFILELTHRAWVHTEDNKRRTLQKSDISAAVTRNDSFDFLIDIVPREEIKPFAKLPLTSSTDSTIRMVPPPPTTQLAITPTTTQASDLQYYYPYAVTQNEDNMSYSRFFRATDEQQPIQHQPTDDGNDTNGINDGNINDANDVNDESSNENDIEIEEVVDDDE
jgi:nuclear transcription factor Y gamma